MKFEKNGYRVIKSEDYEDWDKLQSPMLIKGSPIKEVRRIFPEENGYKGTSDNWNICLVDLTNGRHYRYVVSI